MGSARERRVAEHKRVKEQRAVEGRGTYNSYNKPEPWRVDSSPSVAGVTEAGLPATWLEHDEGPGGDVL